MAGVNGQGWALALKVKYGVGAPCCGWRLLKAGKGDRRRARTRNGSAEPWWREGCALLGTKGELFYKIPWEEKSQGGH